MKGYLQRIAASVVRPQPSLHPLVDSIYVPARPVEAVGVSEPMASRGWRTQSPGDTAVAGVAPPDALARAPLPAPPGRTESDPAPPRIVSRTPVDDASQGRGAAHLEQFDLAAMAGISQFRPSFEPVSTPSLPETEGPSNRPEAAAAGEYLPFARERAPSATAFDAGPQVQTRQAVLAQAREERTPRQAAQTRAAALPAATEGDDIQIHIGRIEVIAVPPPAPRPAAAPARKGLNLDDYLSRRKGGSR